MSEEVRSCFWVEINETTDIDGLNICKGDLRWYQSEEVSYSMELRGLEVDLNMDGAIYKWYVSSEFN